MDYVELRARSAFSFLEGASNPEDLVERAAELGYGALALADRHGLYGMPRFHQAAVAAGVRGIVGARVTVDEQPGARELLLLAESPLGYRHLSRLLTQGHARPAEPAAQRGEAERSRTARPAEPAAQRASRPKAGARQGAGERRSNGKGDFHLSWSDLEEHAAGLVALARGDAALTPEALDRVQGIFAGRAWVDVSRHLERAPEAAARRAVARAEARGVPVVATGDVRHARPDERALLDAFTCLRHKTTLDRAGRLLLPNAERTLRAPAELAERFADRPEWLRATLDVAERCSFGLADLGYRFPDFPVPAGESQASWLRKLVAWGARERYGTPLAPRVRRQLDHELGLIERLELCGYFLIVHDVVCFARSRDVLVQGRGSAANSAVCYALGITAVDPVGMDLLFERFLSEQRGDWPDIDLDLPSGEPRESVIQYVFDRYGERGAAMTATVITYRTRMAVRELGKVLGIEPEALDRLAKLVSSLEHRDDLDELGATLREAGVDVRSPRVALLLDLVDRARGLPRHLGQHTGGVVISAGRLDEVVPIEPAAMPNRRVVQWDKEDCADLGIIKIDLLGLGMLQALEETIPLVRDHEGVTLDLAHLPPDDPPTYEMIRRADTVGVFQIESRAQMATLPRLRPERFYDLVVEIAIIRPGPIVGQMVHPYLARRAGREPVEYPHPSLEPILARTLGVPIFQEQLLRIAMTVAGFSGGEAEELRRAMGFKRSTERMRRIEGRLRAGMGERGLALDVQETILRYIGSFAQYGFPESHSASFALIAYASAYLKRHHPAAFLAGLLNAYPMGFYSPSTLVKDAQRHGVEIRPIDAAHSHWRCSLEQAGPGPARSEAPRGLASREPSGDRRGGTPHGPPAVRIGLRYASGFRADAAEALVAERTRRPFASAADLAKRVSLRRDELDALAELGALASIDARAATRRSALWQVAALERDPGSLFAGQSPPETLDAGSPLDEMSPLDETLADYRLAGLTAGPQVMAHLRAALRRRGVLSAQELRDVPNGRFARIAGHVIVRQRPGSAKGFCFVTLEDETGTANAVLTPAQFKRFRAPLHTAALLEIAGPVQNVEGVIHVRVLDLRPLAPRGALPDSHDYR